MREKYFLAMAVMIIVVGFILIAGNAINGRTIYPTTCQETDNGLDYSTIGSASLGDYTTFDYCINASHLFEYYCSEAGIAGTQYVCPGSCVDGACVDLILPNIISCDDSDGGRNPEQFGAITLTYDNHSQFSVGREHCVGPRRVAETYCSPEEKGYTEEVIYCSIGMNCTDGACW